MRHGLYRCALTTAQSQGVKHVSPDRVPNQELISKADEIHSVGDHPDCVDEQEPKAQIIILWNVSLACMI